MKVYIVVRQAPNNAFIWAAFSTLDKAEEFIDKHDRFDGFRITECIVDED